MRLHSDLAHLTSASHYSASLLNSLARPGPLFGNVRASSAARSITWATLTSLLVGPEPPMVEPNSRPAHPL